MVPLTWLQPVDLTGLPRRQQLLSEVYDPSRPGDAAALTRELEIFHEEHVLALSSAHLAWQRARQMKLSTCFNIPNDAPTVAHIYVVKSSGRLGSASL